MGPSFTLLCSPGPKGPCSVGALVTQLLPYQHHLDAVCALVACDHILAAHPLFPRRSRRSCPPRTGRSGLCGSRGYWCPSARRWPGLPHTSPGKWPPAGCGQSCSHRPPQSPAGGRKSRRPPGCPLPSTLYSSPSSVMALALVRNTSAEKVRRYTSWGSMTVLSKNS